MSGCYDECPECGSTNYQFDYGTDERQFDCGFACNDEDKTALCTRDHKEPENDYRQALIHFSHALDAITEDLQKDGGPVDYIVKLKMLARDALNLAGGDEKTAITHDKKWTEWSKNWGKWSK